MAISIRLIRARNLIDKISWGFLFYQQQTYVENRLHVFRKKNLFEFPLVNCPMNLLFESEILTHCDIDAKRSEYSSQIFNKIHTKLMIYYSIM